MNQSAWPSPTNQRHNLLGLRLMATITAYKSKAGMDGFAEKLQGYEAELICSIVDRLGDVPCFTTYDGIAIPSYLREEAELIFAYETTRLLGFKLMTNVKANALDLPQKADAA